ncbi:lipopolysaccharide assembly protein LapA domain-containing protein [Nocardia sp. CDC159]|uniref:Lipopolysaccharide assembly protein LapA domain-containing protein n=1 Tax=Nocardia pulmonis TaxID=2951408 RepID=A0A9X2E8Z8_9NOCA|nr:MULTISPECIES: lipopolysaccharide assembly protein LapA domain-containing protein [Nocardia]MCM6773911.1 lipopolysaccharide assembly protein LapA domain-containing protein [Nocardia pulmonis]MCM6786798.1 lipopolysaccharide assembly protein LapA domain-containing protein [Nocardia sp. CDC159]
MTSDAVSSPGPDPVSRADPAAPTTPTPPAGTPAPTTPTTPAQTTTAPTKHSRSLRTRTGYTWTALVAAAILGIVLLIFILQNSNQVQTHLFFWDFTQPLGVTILLSVIAGALVMALVGGGRILQLRRAAKRN